MHTSFETHGIEESAKVAASNRCDRRRGTLEMKVPFPRSDRTNLGLGKQRIDRRGAHLLNFSDVSLEHAGVTQSDLGNES